MGVGAFEVGTEFAAFFLAGVLRFAARFVGALFVAAVVVVEVVVASEGVEGLPTETVAALVEDGTKVVTDTIFGVEVTMGVMLAALVAIVLVIDTLFNACPFRISPFDACPQRLCTSPDCLGKEFSKRG